MYMVTDNAVPIHPIIFNLFSLIIPPCVSIYVNTLQVYIDGFTISVLSVLSNIPAYRITTPDILSSIRSLLARFVELVGNFLYFCRMSKHIENIAFLNNGIALRKDDFSPAHD